MLILGTLVACAFGAPSAGEGPGAPRHLRCEYLESPMAVGEAAPRLSWLVTDDRRGARQSAYEIHVATSPGAARSASPDVWSSGRVESDRPFHNAYAGPALRSGARYFWAVRTWDGAGSPSDWSDCAAFTMALLDPSDWKAAWIGDPTPPPAVEPARNGAHSAFATDAGALKSFTIDLASEREFDSVTLFPAQPYDLSPPAPGFGFPVRFRVIASETPDFASPAVLADRTGADTPPPGATPVVVTFPKASARYVRLEATRLREVAGGRFALALAELEVGMSGAPVSTGARASASDGVDNPAWAPANLTDGDRESHGLRGLDALPSPMFRHEFRAEKPAARAVLRVSALGLYEVYIDGRRIGRHQLAPEWTDYLTRVQYQAFDVTDLVSRGEHCIGASVGDGWYAGRLGMAQGLSEKKWPRAVYGRTPRFLAQLDIEYPDGSRQTVATDGSWSSTLEGPIRSADLLDGEVYDARREMPGWNAPGFRPTAGWAPAAVDRTVGARLVPQVNEPILGANAVPARSMSEPAPGVFVYDFGQNLPGRTRVTVSGRAGATLRIRHAEAVNDDGTLYTANLRGAPQIDTYTLRGDPAGETWEPAFTYHGFRFVELSGDIDRPGPASVLSVPVHTAPRRASAFACSSDLVNMLWANILRTQCANLMSVPTDCPQRDERLGWMGDILSFAPTASVNMDLGGFYTKWMQDVRDAQADDGRFPDFAPQPYGRNVKFTGVPGWGDAGVFVPWTAYQFYADERLLERHFDSARRWVDWIRSNNPDLIWRNNRGNDYNDWLNGDTLIAEGWPRKGASVPNDLFATGMFAESTRLVAEMARVLGREQDRAAYEDLHAKIVAAFRGAFIGADGSMPGDTQAGYALALQVGMATDADRARILDRLVAGIRARDNHLSTGFHTTRWAMRSLMDGGLDDLAGALVQDTRFPSWGYSIENGATTIWERWDGYVKGRGFQDPGMNSLNHWAFGSVGEWIFGAALGVQIPPVEPGFRRFVVSPRPSKGLDRAEGYYLSIRGPIEVAWTDRPETFSLTLTVPPGARADVVLPVRGRTAVRESGVPLAQAGHVSVVSTGPERCVLGVDSGTYTFECSRP